MSVKSIKDESSIFRFLKQDRLYAAYAIGDLEPFLFNECEWHAAFEEEQIIALCLRFRGLPPDRIFVMGQAEGLIPILDDVVNTEAAYFAFRPEHLSVVRKFYSLQRLEHMLRMVLAADDFIPVEGPVSRLGPMHVGRLQELYRLGGDVAFAPYQIEQGVFYGVERDGSLVATAGTHLVSRTYGLGIVGNVFTHPDYRGHGYATVCCSAVVEELLSQSLDVVLNVEQNNEPALSTYERLGFNVYCPFLEALGWRRAALRGRLLSTN